MRPRRLELEGFTSFRARTVVEFGDEDLFVLTGATGAGKSSLIDAMIFALYGTIPRLEDGRLVHPVISQGSEQAKVRFDFNVDGRSYSAVRVVRRTRQGANVREARLESEGAVLAGSAKELDAKVEQVIGLGLEQFTTCVVLPQGEFATFLHAKPRDRQDLLVRLLGAQIYERVRQAAQAREAAAKQSAELAERELEGLTGANEAALREVKTRLRALEKLLRKIEAVQPELEALLRSASEQENAANGLVGEAERLERLRVPDTVQPLAARLAELRRDLGVKRGEREAREDATAAAAEGRAKLGDPRPLEAALLDHRELAEVRQRIAAGANELAAIAARVESPRQAHEAAKTAREQAEERLAALEREHAAHVLSDALVPGQACPVCQQPVAKVPHRRKPAQLGSAKLHLERAKQAEATADRALREAEGALAQADGRAKAEVEREKRIQVRLAKAPPLERIEDALKSIAAADEKKTRADAAAVNARDAERRVEKGLHAHEAQVSAAWAQFDSAWSTVATLEPPAPNRADLEASWRALVDSGERLAPKRRAAAQAARDAAAEANRGAAQKLAEQLSECARQAVEVGRRLPRDAVADALAEARARVGAIERGIARATELRSRVETERRAAHTAGALERHLRANGFERWLLEEAFERLVRGASALLREQLSGGQYSLRCDSNLNFEVVDHRNADEPRSIRTLSGGETFLASLALALALSDDVAQLAAGGAARLDALFLDEGFGALDSDVLDTVATAIEELGARGRMVGIVTHVRELADRIPVQYRVTRGPSGSSVERVVL